MTVEISSIFNHHRVSGWKSDKPSVTQQNFKRECDINLLMARYLEGDVPLVDPLKVRSGEPQFGDFYNIPDLMTAQNKIIEAQQMFYSLPSNIRKRFDNDPVVFVDFVSDKDNEDEMRELGILPKIYTGKDGLQYYFRNGVPVYISDPENVQSQESET